MVAYSFAVLVLLKGLSAPVVLYTESPKVLYEELKHLWQKASVASPKLIEKETSGPLKRVCFYDIDIVGLALQGDTPHPLLPQAHSPVSSASYPSVSAYMKPSSVT
ncbi:MAG: hypothetical protein ACKO37_01895 [Vampirovibrionales bacterium]